MENVLATSEVSLAVFGGVDTELSPTDCPQGISPDLMNMAFLPGSAFTRPPLKTLLPYPDNVQIVYAKSFLKPDGTTVQFVLDSRGRFWSDSTQIGTTKAGNRVKTITAFGREYIAISDGLHGADVPLQYDGEFLDRVSQDGPGSGCTVANYSIPPVALVSGSAGAGIAITSATPSDPQQVQVGGGNEDPFGGYDPPIFETVFFSIVYVTATPHGLGAGQTVSVSGNSLWNTGSTSVLAVIDPSTFSVSTYQTDGSVGTGGTVTPYIPLLSRSNNRVTAYTASPHGFRTGYRVAVSGIPDATKTVSQIVINNDQLPGVAKITVSNHGFVPGNPVTLTGVDAVSVGGGIDTIDIHEGTATLETNTPHGLQAGAVVLVQTGTGPNLPFTVSQIISPVIFTYADSRANVTLTGGTVQETFPAGTTNTFPVVDVIDQDNFTIAVSYSNGTWTTGTISFPWNGTFYVTSVPSSTSFTYAQSGPNAVLSSGTGTVTARGQIAPGRHNCVVIFQTRQGYLTVPSPNVRIEASGEQYIIASNIPIGPSNVVARVLAFTPANGSRYFYIPVPVRSQGIVVSSSTVVNDNTTTSAVFDFSDQALIAATAIDIPGNNLFNQVVLGPVLGFFPYASRLNAWGERNKVQKFRNMGFEGGIYAGAPNSPLGWSITGTGILTAGDYGYGWKPTGGATISQAAYQDQYGLPIIQPQTKYLFRGWSQGSCTATLSSVSTGFSSTATISPNGGFAEAEFSQEMPVTIPQDLVLTFTGTDTMDELAIIYAQNPYLMVARESYANNPEAFDDVTGRIGPSGDPNEICSLFERKDILHFLTQGPNGSLYQTQDTASGEPSTWSFNHVASKCGGISVWGDAQFEDWHVWASDTGLRIYDGGNVDKMSQEVQPWWNSFQLNAKQFTVVANDPYERRIYTLAVIGVGHTVPDSCYMMDYRELNTAAMLSSSGPLKLGRSGGLFTTDLSRKWSPWPITANFCGLLSIGGGARMTFCAGSGTNLAANGFGKVYDLLEGDISGIDDDYGAFDSWYTTYFFIAPDEAQDLRMIPHRKLYAYMSMSISGIGRLQVTPLVNALDNPWPRPMPTMPVPADATYDTECGANVLGERVAFKLQPVPNSGQIARGFNLNSFTMSMRTDPFMPIRGTF